MLSIGICRVCETGPLGLRRCGVCRRVVVLCDECDAAWGGDPRETKPSYANERGMPCPRCRADLWSSGASWATSGEAGADGFDLGNATESAPFKPGR